MLAAGNPGGDPLFREPPMQSFADLLETTAQADSSDTERNLTTTAAVKTALKITNSDSDGLIATLIPRVTGLIVNDCRLARDAAGAEPTFALETLRATWYAAEQCRGPELRLPWRPPLASIDEVTEDGIALAAGSDFIVKGNGRAVRLCRLSGDRRCDWKPAKIVVTFKAGFASVLSGKVAKDLEAAAIDQVKALFFGTDRDPAIRSESVPDVASVSYAIPGGDAMDAPLLSPGVRSMLRPWRDPVV